MNNCVISAHVVYKCVSLSLARARSPALSLSVCECVCFSLSLSVSHSLVYVCEASNTLFFWLIGYDPTSFWDGMSHAAPSWAFQLYLWSYLIIVYFILFNVLLAILIDTYCEVKGGQDPDAPGSVLLLCQGQRIGFTACCACPLPYT